MSDKIMDCFNPHHASMEDALIVRDKEVIRLERELAEVKGCFTEETIDRGKLVGENAELQAEAVVMREALGLILPMAKGYAAAHRVGSNAEYIAHAEAALSTNAGRKVLDVVEAAKDLVGNIREHGSHDNWKGLAEALATMEK